MQLEQNIKRSGADRESYTAEGCEVRYDRRARPTTICSVVKFATGFILVVGVVDKPSVI